MKAKSRRRPVRKHPAQLPFREHPKPLRRNDDQSSCNIRVLHAILFVTPRGKSVARPMWEEQVAGGRLDTPEAMHERKANDIRHSFPS